MNNTALAIATTLVATMMAAGCTGATDKSGGEISPRTLLLASNDGAETDGALARFVELVEDKSGGQIQIEVSPEWKTKGEQQVLEDVAAGKAELGWSGTRAFDLIGVDSFRALHAPFLIDSYPAQQAVVEDDVAQDMLAGLDGTALTGLALLADELRFPAAAEGPLLDAGDFDGLAFGIMPSNAQSTAMTALGSRVTAMAVPHSPATDGLEGLETMWNTYVKNGQQRIVPFVTANAALWPRTTVVVANAKELEGLDKADREVLTQAATEAAQWAGDHADDQVADEIAQACSGGARVATASPDQLAALARAARPAYDALRAEPEQAALLARVERLVRGTGDPEPIDVPEGCAYQRGDEDHLAVHLLPAPLARPGDPGELPAGTYRYTLTQDEIREGVDMDDAFAVGNAGVWTWTLGEGRWHYELKQTAQDVPEGYDDATTCEGYYDVHGNEVDFTTLTVYVAEDCASKTWKADWRQTGNGLLLDVTTDSDDLDFLFGAKAWERIR